MPAPTAAELLTLLTEDQLRAKLLSYCSSSGFPVSSWASTSVPRALIAGDVACHKVLTDQVPEIVKGGTLRDASGAWLDLRLTDYGTGAARIAAKTTIRKLRLTDVGGGPLPLTKDAVIVETAAGLRYYLNANVTVPGGGGFVDADFRAELAGEAYNASTSGWSFVTSIPGVSISEPAITLTVQGADEEKDDSAKQRAQAQWPGLGGGANDDVYTKWAKEAAPGDVVKVAVKRHYPAPGQVSLALGGTSAPVAGGVATAVQSYIAPRAPNCIDAFASPAVVRAIVVTGTCYVLAAELANAQTKGLAAIALLEASLPIGAALPLDLITKTLRAGMSDDPRNDVDVSSPLSDFAAGAWNEQITIDASSVVWAAV